MSQSRIKVINNYLDNLYYSFNNLSLVFTKRNKNFMLVKDGIITYKIRINNKLYCQCCDKNNYYDRYNNLYCKHIFYLLKYHFKLNNYAICYLYLDEVHELFKSNYKKNKFNLNSLLEKKIGEVINSKECAICYNNLRVNKPLYQCSKCKNIVHMHCFNKWLKYKAKDHCKINKGCIFCKEKVI